MLEKEQVAAVRRTRTLGTAARGPGCWRRALTERVLLVDLENVQKIDLSQVPGDARVMIFYGVTQKKLPEELVVQAQPLGVRLKWIKISG